VYEITYRIRRAAESILENESLTADLDDEAARLLLDWGVSCAEKIAAATEGLSDAEAEEAMAPGLRATRRLMRLVNRWVTERQGIGPEGSGALLAEIMEQATIIYGGVPSDSDIPDALLRAQSESVDDPPSMITSLRELVEHPGGLSTISQGVHNDQEVTQDETQ